MYKLKLHKNLDGRKWETFDNGKQLLMIANELNRAKNWIITEDLEEITNCYERAFELLDLTISITRNKNKLKELLRFREMLAIQYVSKEKHIRKTEQLFNVLISLDKHSYEAIT